MFTEWQKEDQTDRWLLAAHTYFLSCWPYVLVMHASCMSTCKLLNYSVQYEIDSMQQRTVLMTIFLSYVLQLFPDITQVDIPSDSEVKSLLKQQLCDLLAYKELVGQIADEAYNDLQVILQQNVQDICQWVSDTIKTHEKRLCKIIQTGFTSFSACVLVQYLCVYIVCVCVCVTRSYTCNLLHMQLKAVTTSPGYFQVNQPCSSTEITRLQRVCIRLKVQTFNSSLVSKASLAAREYYAAADDIENSIDSPCQWVEQIQGIPESQKSAIKKRIFC